MGSDYQGGRAPVHLPEREPAPDTPTGWCRRSSAGALGCGLASRVCAVRTDKCLLARDA